MDPSISTAITASIESVINGALKYDPASRQKIAKITDILAIESRSPALTIYCHGSDDGIVIMSHCQAPTLTQLTGTPLALVSLLKKPTTLAGSGVELAGSVALLQRWQAVLKGIDIDWEDAISSVLGDIAGPMVGKIISGGLSWSQQQGSEQVRMFKEYITEELKVTPSKAELSGFSQAVSDITMDAQRLQARFTKHLSKTPPYGPNHNKDTHE